MTTRKYNRFISPEKSVIIYYTYRYITEFPFDSQTTENSVIWTEFFFAHLDSLAVNIRWKRPGIDRKHRLLEPFATLTAGIRDGIAEALRPRQPVFQNVSQVEHDGASSWGRRAKIDESTRQPFAPRWRASSAHAEVFRTGNPFSSPSLHSFIHSSLWFLPHVRNVIEVITTLSFRPRKCAADRRFAFWKRRFVLSVHTAQLASLSALISWHLLNLTISTQQYRVRTLFEKTATIFETLSENVAFVT